MGHVLFPPLSGHPPKKSVIPPLGYPFFGLTFRVRKRRGREKNSCHRHSPSSKSKRLRVSCWKAQAFRTTVTVAAAVPRSGLSVGFGDSAVSSQLPFSGPLPHGGGALAYSGGCYYYTLFRDDPVTLLVKWRRQNLMPALSHFRTSAPFNSLGLRLTQGFWGSIYRAKMNGI